MLFLQTFQLWKFLSLMAFNHHVLVSFVYYPMNITGVYICLFLQTFQIWKFLSLMAFDHHVLISFVYYATSAFYTYLLY